MSRLNQRGAADCCGGYYHDNLRHLKDCLVKIAKKNPTFLGDHFKIFYFMIIWVFYGLHFLKDLDKNTRIFFYLEIGYCPVNHKL